MTTRLLFLELLAVLVCTGCGPRERSVVAYVSVDQIYSEPILQAFERESGIRVRAVYDVEAAKTTGLTTRLASEKQNPRADVFWNGEFAQTLRLKEQGVLAPFQSSSAADLPLAFRDAEGYWFGLGGRARVFIINRNLLKPEDYPTKLEDFLDPRYPPDRIGLALPLFGTTATHAAALYQAMGAGPARDFFASLKARGIRVAEGNSVVRDRVADGRWWFGLTDTDDAKAALDRGAPVDVRAPDQDGRGTLIIPGTVALVRGAPHPEEASRLIEYLLKAETENALIKAGFCQWSLRGDARAVPMFPDRLRSMTTSLDEVHRQLPFTMVEMREIFLR